MEDQAEKNKEARKNSRTNNLNEVRTNCIQNCIQQLALQSIRIIHFFQHYIPPVITDEQLTAANRKVQELIAENEEKNKRISELEKLLIEVWWQKLVRKYNNGIAEFFRKDEAERRAQYTSTVTS